MGKIPARSVFHLRIENEKHAMEGTMTTRIARLMTEHPASVNETYLEHMAFASRFGFTLLAAAGAALVHAFLPFLFEKTASNIVRGLYERTYNRGR